MDALAQEQPPSMKWWLLDERFSPPPPPLRTGTPSSRQTAGNDAVPDSKGLEMTSFSQQERGMDALAREQQREISGLREEVSSRPTGSRHFYRKRVVTSLYFLL